MIIMWVWVDKHCSKDPVALKYCIYISELDKHFYIKVKYTYKSFSIELSKLKNKVYFKSLKMIVLQLTNLTSI